MAIIDFSEVEAELEDKITEHFYQATIIGNKSALRFNEPAPSPQTERVRNKATERFAKKYVPTMIKTTDKHLEIERIILAGIEQGKGPRALIKQIKDVTGLHRRAAEKIARTETSRAYNTAKISTMTKQGYEKAYFVASETARTCDRCRALHLKIFPIDEISVPPIHPNCRCSISPITRYTEVKRGKVVE